MFERLAGAIDDLEVPAHGDALVEVLVLVDRLSAKVSAVVGEFDAEGGWEVEGATSAAAWLRSRAGMTHANAAAIVRTAKRLRSLPVTSAAWSRGELSGGQVSAIVANVDQKRVDLFAEHESAVVPALVSLSVPETATAMNRWRARADALIEDAPPAEPERSVHLSRTMDGRFELKGSLDVEGGEMVATVLQLAAVDDFERLPSVKRGDALVDVCRFFLDHQHDRPSRRNRPHLNVVVDADGARLVNGGALDAPTTKRLLCDANVHRVVTDGRSTILDYGRATRTVPANLWNALVLRDEHCRHAGCDRPAHFCEAHHVVPWTEGGTTSLDNLVLKCTRHHHIGHLPGWHEKLKPDGTLVTSDPQGRTRTTRPPGPGCLGRPRPLMATSCRTPSSGRRTAPRSVGVASTSVAASRSSLC